jgi:hypothetical protein
MSIDEKDRNIFNCIYEPKNSASKCRKGKIIIEQNREIANHTNIFEGLLLLSVHF